MPWPQGLASLVTGGSASNSTTSDGLNNSLAISALFASFLWSVLFSLVTYMYHFISSRVWGCFVVELTVDRRFRSGDAFDVLAQWLRSQRVVSPPHSITAEVDPDDSDDDNEPGEAKEPLLFLPSEFASMSIVHRGRRIWVTRLKHENKQVYGRSGESLRLTCLGWTAEPLKELMREAHHLAQREAAGNTRVYFVGDSGQWGGQVLRRARPLSTVFLSAAALRVRDDVAEFLRSRQWYMDRGLPWRRGYLLHGPPGNGKSSFVFALASELQLSVYVITLSSLSDKTLRELFDEVRGRALVLLEDVDSAVVGATDRRRTASSAGNGEVEMPDVNNDSSKSAASPASFLTLSGLLNAIDGVGAAEGRVLFLTTNHRQLLDPALIRPGRVDMQVEFRNASHQQIVDMFARFYSANTAASAKLLEQASQFASCLPAESVSMAELQCHLLLYKNDPDAAIAAAADLVSRSHQKSTNQACDLTSAVSAA